VNQHDGRTAQAIPLDVDGARAHGDAKDVGVDGGLRYREDRSTEKRLGRVTKSNLLSISGPAITFSSTMSEETYDAGRARTLEALLRSLSERIRELDSRGELLPNAGELMRLIGDVRSELFHYEVRATYDTPEIAESRRVVRDAKQDTEPTWHKTEWKADEDDNPEW
jgi:hypothetical protein